MGRRSFGTTSDHFQSTRWLGREVISKGQRPWGGCLDGMNSDGLVASVTFGGSTAQGEGFSIILIARYVLETCNRVSDAVAALCRIPVALSQNVTVLDRTGYATVYLTPIAILRVADADVPTIRSRSTPTLSRRLFGARSSVGTQRCALSTADLSLADLAQTFLTAPLYSRDAQSPTVYSAIYRPAESKVHMCGLAM
jgi:predicted choloylglycine hydrolase